MTDDVGERGEKIAFLLLTRFLGRAEPLFRPRALGEKTPAGDYLVELTGAGVATPFFFAQVKSTRSGYTSRGARRRLRTPVSASDLAKLGGYPAPTYLIGVDEPAERGYIVFVAPEAPLRPSSLTVRYPLDDENLETLWSEVRDYWDAHGRRAFRSAYR